MARMKYSYNVAYNRPILTLLSMGLGVMYAFALIAGVSCFIQFLWLYGIIAIVIGILLFFIQSKLNKYIDESNVNEYIYYEEKQQAYKLWEQDKITEKEYEERIRQINKARKSDNGKG